MKKILPVLSQTILMAAVVLLTVSGCKKDPLKSKPVACIDAVAANVQAGTAVTFSSSCTEGAISLVWSFGDGDVSTAATVAHTYDAGGTYTVTLTVTNAEGTSTATKTITVTDPRAQFVGSYQATDSPGPFNYTVAIGNGSSTNSLIISNNFSDGFYVNSIFATVSGNTITIPTQDPDSDAYVLAGTGTISSGTITLSYTITNSGTTYPYTGTWVKQ